MRSSRILVPALVVGVVAVAPFLRNAIASEPLEATPTQVPPYPSGGPMPSPTPSPTPAPTPMPTAPSIEAGAPPILSDAGR